MGTQMGTEREDRSALAELKAAYFRLLDTKRWAAWRELFTDDMVFINESGPVPTEAPPMTTSGDDFVEMVSATLADAVTVHQGHTPELTFADDRHAHGVWAMFDWVEHAGNGGSGLQGFGHYHERYVKGDDGRWRIALLRLTRLRVDPVPPSGAVPPEVAPWTRPAKG